MTPLPQCAPNSQVGAQNAAQVPHMLPDLCSFSLASMISFTRIIFVVPEFSFCLVLTNFKK